MAYSNDPFLIRWINDLGAHEVYAETEFAALMEFSTVAMIDDVRAAEVWQRTGDCAENVRRKRIAYYNNGGTDSGFTPMPFEARPVY